MKAIDNQAPAELWRAWSSEWLQVGEWTKKPPMTDLTAAEGGGLTVDYPNGRRDSWRVVAGELIPEWEMLKKMSVWCNPFLPWTPDESQEEYLERAERARLRGDFGLDWMINGLPDERHHSGAEEQGEEP